VAVIVWLPPESDHTENVAFPSLTVFVLRVMLPSNREIVTVAAVLDCVTAKVTGSPETTVEEGT
jgi:hypothetical protein